MLTPPVAARAPLRVVGRYAVYDEIGHGGMAAVHFGRLFGPVGFSRTVAIKMLHPPFAKDPAFVSMLLDEARLASRILHPNVVQTIDVVANQGELFVVMEYVHGESLARLMRDARAEGAQIPPGVAIAILSGVLQGLHAAHEAKSARGEPLEIVHRDVSPDNILVGIDGIAKVADFGVAKARGRCQTTSTGEVKGKLSYMAPEQLEGAASRLTDVFAASIVLWEMLAGRRLFDGIDTAERIGKLHRGAMDSPRAHRPDLSEALECAVMRGLERDASKRFPTALEMAMALQNAVTPASPLDVAQWLEANATPVLERRAAQLATMENPSQQDVPSHAEEAASAADPEEESAGAERTRAVPGLAGPVSARRTPLPASRARRYRKVAAWALGALTASAALAYAMRPPPLQPSLEGASSASAPAPSASASSASAPSASAPSTSARSASAPSTSARSASAPSASAPSTSAPSTSAPSTSTPSGAAAVRAKGKVRSTRPAPSAEHCSPAYTIGADGLRHYKPECW